MPAREVDLKLVGGRVVTGGGVLEAGVAVDGGTIVAVAHDDLLPPARRTIDVRGNHILPGIVDSEAHPGCYVPFEDDLEPESRAAACAGITTWGIQAPSTRLGTRPFKEYVQADDVVPFSSRSPPPRETIERVSVGGLLPHLHDGDRRPGRGDPAVLRGVRGHLLQALHAGPAHPGRGPQLAEPAGRAGGRDRRRHPVPGHGAGGPLRRPRHLLHPPGELGDRPGVRAPPARARATTTWPPGPTARPTCWRPSTSGPTPMWPSSSAPACTSSTPPPPRPSSEIREARRRGVELYAQTGPAWLGFSPFDGWRINVPLRYRETQEALWQALARGDVDVVGSDHVVAWPPADREAMYRQSIWDCRTGFSRVETFLPVMLIRRRPQGPHHPGAAGPGVLREPGPHLRPVPGQGGALPSAPTPTWSWSTCRREVTVGKEHLNTRAGWSIMEGKTYHGWPVLTLLGGQVTAEWADDSPGPRPVGEPRGRYLPTGRPARGPQGAQGPAGPDRARRHPGRHPGRQERP